MKRLSIKLKITLWYILVMIIISGVVFTAMTSISQKMLENDIQDRITRSVRDVSRRLERPGNIPGQKPQNQQPQTDNGAPPPQPKDGEAPPQPKDMRENQTNQTQEFKLNISEPELYTNGIHMAIYDSDKNLVMGSIPFEIENPPEFEEDCLNIISTSSGKYYIDTKRIEAADGNSYWIRGVASVNDEGFALKSALKINITMTVILIIIAALGGYFIIKRTLKPVEDIRRTADEISESSDLSRRIELSSGNDEFYQLAASFDKMLDKIEQTLEREKQFTSDASHELRTPVAAILSSCEYMTNYAKDYEEMRTSALSVKAEAERMSKLISQLLMISRMDKNSLQLNYEDVDLGELLNFVCDEQEEINNESSIVLHRDIEQDIVVSADRFMLARLCINLISNAYRYGKKDGNIYVSLTAEDKKAVLKVADDGIGIAEDQLPKIWERFYQAEPARSESGSAGLGLSMVKWIASRHGGEVSASSKKGEGSVFTFVMERL